MRFLQLHSVHWLWKLWDSPHLDTAWFTGEVRQETLMTLYATTWWPHTQNDWVGVRLQAHSCLEKSSALWLALAVNTLWGDTHTHTHTHVLRRPLWSVGCLGVREDSGGDDSSQRWLWAPRVAELARRLHTRQMKPRADRDLQPDWRAWRWSHFSETLSSAQHL